VTNDGGLLTYRERDEALGLIAIIHAKLRDIRRGKNTQHDLAALLRQAIYSRLAGYEDTNDAERLAVDPAMRHVAGGRAIERAAASTVISHSRYVTFQMAEAAVPRGTFLVRLCGRACLTCLSSY
jgi:hypothetical protein